MKLSLAVAAIALVSLAGCASGVTDASDDAPPAADPPPAEDDLTKAKVFTCSSNDADSFDNLTITGTGSRAKVSVTDEQSTKYTASFDATYTPRSSKSDLKRFTWDKDDPWQDSGGSWMLVSADLLAGRAGVALYQVRGETFESNTMHCSPKK